MFALGLIVAACRGGSGGGNHDGGDHDGGGLLGPGGTGGASTDRFETCKAAKPQGSACTEQDECGATAWCPEGTCRNFTFADLDICDGDLD